MKCFKKTLKFFFLGLFALYFYTHGFAVEEIEESKLISKAEKKEDYEQVFGKITDLLITENKTMLTLDRPEKEMMDIPAAQKQVKFTLDKDTQITDGTQDLNLSDLKIGQHIRVLYTEKGLGRRLAQAVVIQN
jgi:hypothetical protein